jgi:hypothetical protein
MVVRSRFTTVALFCSVLVALVLASATPARAQGDTRAAKRAYELGYKALQAGKYGEALVHYQRSYRLVPRPRTLFNVAVCQEKLSKGVDAWRSYHAFLRAAQPRDASIAAQARDRIAVLRRTLRGTLSITSNPSGAVVRLDGKRMSRGRTPLTLLVRPGKRLVRVSMTGARPAERTVTVEPEKTTSIMVPLALASAITIRAEPRDAVIKRKGQDAEARGTYDARVRPGTYEFTIRRRGYLTERLRIKALAGRTYEQRVQLKRNQTGGTFVLVGAGGATVTLDGSSQGLGVAGNTRQRFELNRVAAGEHELRVERTGYVPWMGNLHLSPGERVEVDLSLAKHPTRRARWLRWGGIGLGVAGLSLGTVFGVQALRDVASDSSSRHERGKTRAVIADGLFVAGVAGLITAWRLSKRSSSSAKIRRAYGGE